MCVFVFVLWVAFEVEAVLCAALVFSSPCVRPVRVFADR